MSVTRELPPIQAHARATRNEIVSRIQRARALAGITVPELCDRLNANGWDISPSTLSGMLSGGKRTGIPQHELDYFAAALGCSVLDLLPQSVTDAAEERLMDSSVAKFMEGFGQAEALVESAVRVALERAQKEAAS